jgi:hypothetical protein
MKPNKFTLTSDYDGEETPVEYLIDRMRLHRDRLLAESDWAMAPDAPTDKTAWAAYRQDLRDFPSTWTPGPEANFPEEPTT